MSRGRNFFKKALVAVSVIIFVFAASILILFACVRQGIDYTVDEALFKSSSRGPTRLLYYDSELSEYVEGEILSSGGVRKIKCGLDEISDYLKLGFIAMEDRGFYSHGGVDYKRTLGAIINYITRKSPIYGASTITQQVIKNISGDNEVKITRKLAEIIRAMHIESTHTKDEILELYLNIVPYTDNTVGVGLASRQYFGKEPSELTLAEAATLVGITNAPAKYNPRKHPEECVKKRNRVLYAMHEFGVIDNAAYNEAVCAPLEVLPKSDSLGYSSWFCETVISDAALDISEKYSVTPEVARFLITSGGYDIYTTQNPKMQAAVDGYFENGEYFAEAREKGLNYSFVITDSRTNELLAIYGSSGKKSGERLLNYATVPITPGSVLKPLALYAPLIDRGRVSWASVFDDYPVSYSKEGEGYSVYPHNYPDVYDGLLPLHEALEKSKNTVALRLYSMLGGENIYHMLRWNFDFTTLVRAAYNENGGKLTDIAPAPLALGQLTNGISLRKLTAAYTVFPSEGVYRECISYTRISDGDGGVLIEKSPRERRIFKAENARVMNKLLEGVVSRGTARRITLGDTVDTAGKTGTSGGDRDRLFIGYTPYLTAGIWCGGSGGAIGSLSHSHLEIWDGIMHEAHEAVLKNNESPEPFSTEGLLHLPYCRDSGGVYTEICELDPRGERLEYGYFTVDNLPCGVCDRHILTEVYGDAFPSGYVALVTVDNRNEALGIRTKDEAYVYKPEYGIIPDENALADFIYNERRKHRYGL